MDGDTVFLAYATMYELDPPKVPLPPTPRWYPVNFVWTGGTLASRRSRFVAHDGLKEAAAKVGWYLTADYSTKPPRVILTKEPTVSSRWTFIGQSVSGSSSVRCYLRNYNDDGKEAWLGMEKIATAYCKAQKTPAFAGGDVKTRYWKTFVCKPVLSFTEKTPFDVLDVEEDGGK